MRTPPTDDPLAALVAEQARDDATDRLPGDDLVVREADLTVARDGRRSRGDLDRLLARGGRRAYWIFLKSCRPTERWEHDQVRRGIMECPACKSRPIRDPLVYCEECDACGDEAKAARDGLRVDEEPDWLYIREYGLNATKYRRGKVRGGVGA